ncbi:hypothetical protein [Roseivirga pacifica]
MRTRVFRAYILLAVSIIALGLYVFRQAYLKGDTDYFYIKQSLEEPYGLKYNKRRSQLGIPQLPEEWFTYDTSQRPGVFFRVRKKQDHFWLNQVWHPIAPESRTGHYEKEIRRTTKGLVYELDRYRKVQNDSLEYVLELKYNYLYKPHIEASLIKSYDKKEGLEIYADSVDLASLDSLRLWMKSD